MKKLIIAAAIVCAAVASQASNFNWTYYTGAEDNGLMVYCIPTAAGTSFESAEQLIAASIGSGEIVEDWDPDYFASGSGVSDTYVTGSIKGGDGAANAYFAIVSANGEQFKMTEAADYGAYVYDPGQQESAPSTASITSSQFGAYQDFGGPSPEPIPEPTSGLLLLLGVAGLALRRRRA